MSEDPRDAWIAEALRSRAEHSHPRSDCPHPERIWDAVRLQTSLDGRLEIIDHISECPTCAEAWSLAAELAPASEPLAQPEENALPLQRLTSPESSPLSAFYSKTAILVGAAAVLLFAIGIGFLVLRPAARPTPDVAATLQQRGQQGAALPQGDFLLRWTSGPTGSRYDVTVMTPDKDVIAEVWNLEVTEYRVPPERLAGVGDNAALLWRVVARTPEGSTVSSDLLPFRLQEMAPLARLASEMDVTSIQELIAAFEQIVETNDLSRLRDISPSTAAAQFDALQTELQRLPETLPKYRLEDLEDVEIKVLAYKLVGRTVETAIERQDTAVVKGRRISLGYYQILTFDKTTADSWSLAAIRRSPFPFDRRNPFQ